MTSLLLFLACSGRDLTVDVDLMASPVRVGDQQREWPQAGDPRARVTVARFRDDVPTGRPLTVRVGPDTAAQRVALMQEITPLDHIRVVSSESTAHQVRFIATTDKPLEHATCWLPIVHVPSGEIMVAASGEPARHWQRAEHRLVASPGCVSTPTSMASTLLQIKNRCSNTAIAVDSQIEWEEVLPWLTAVESAKLLVEEPAVLSTRAAAAHGKCSAAVEPTELGSP